jgi:hypothetical protein
MERALSLMGDMRRLTWIKRRLGAMRTGFAAFDMTKPSSN